MELDPGEAGAVVSVMATLRWRWKRSVKVCAVLTSSDLQCSRRCFSSNAERLHLHLRVRVGDTAQDT
jgi:hypothetical protein